MASKPARGLIIAIEEYPKADGLSKKLEGIGEAANSFYQWLTTEKKLDSGNIVVCADQNFTARAPDAGTTMDEIVDTLTALLQTGRDQTSDLFFFYSGHGFAWRTSSFEKPADIFVASNFRTKETSGRLTARFSELRELLRICLGGKQHFFFLDACRTILEEGEIQVGSLGLALQRAIQGAPEISTMFSVATGQAAFTNSGFTPALLTGLRGDGGAKGWEQGKLYVKFPLLRDYIRKKIGSRVEASGEGLGLIQELVPPPQSNCEITVIDAAATDKFKVRAQSGPIVVNLEFQGPSTTLQLTPSIRGYDFSVKFEGTRAEQKDPPPGEFLDFCEPRSLTFAKGTPLPVEEEGLEGLSFAMPEPPPETRVNLRIAGGADGNIILTNQARGTVIRSDGPMLVQTVIPGKYTAQVLQQGVIVATHALDVKPRVTLMAELPLDPPNWLLEQARAGDSPEWQQSIRTLIADLGPGAASNLSLWIALLGSQDPPPIPSGQSQVLVLAGSQADASPSAGLGKVPAWTKLQALLPGLFRFHQVVEPGPQLVSFAFPGGPVHTFSTFAFPGRSTVLAFSEDEKRRLVLRQFVLPASSRQIQRLIHQQDRFEKREKLSEPQPQPADNQDPVAVGVAVHEMLRDGLSEAEQETLRSLQTVSSALPDMAILPALLNEPVPTPSAPPLLTESLLTLPAYREMLPLPISNLDYDSIWLSWTEAVPRPEM